MSREGFLIMDSDLHLMEPEDLWARYLDEPYRANPPKFFGAQKQSLAPNKEDKGNTDTIFGIEVQGQVIPAFANAPGAIRQSRELARRSRARAYNNWAHEYCQSHPERLRFAGQVAMHDIGLAVEEARRCVNELGAVAIIGTPNPVNGLHLHDGAVG